MSDLIKIAVDAMGGDNSPKKVIDGIIHNHKNNINLSENVSCLLKPLYKFLLVVNLIKLL